MRIVHVRVCRGAFADTMATMRDWLDRNGDPVLRFETAGDAAGDIVIRVDFPTANLAAAFHRDFGGALSECWRGEERGNCECGERNVDPSSPVS